MTHIPMVIILSNVVVTINVSAGQSWPMTAGQILRAIDRLGTLGSVLYIGAHPDDENGRLLTFLTNHEHVRAAYLSLTRGEGGQNLIGAEQAPLLGVIRTQELLAARRIDGAEQFFGRERDFGYAKTPEETLATWGEEQALSDVVWVIRRFQPDVIITRFSPEDRDTHGHHTASAMLAVKPFVAAADSTQFAWQLDTVQPWAARRLVWNRGSFREIKPEERAQLLAVEVGSYDPLTGLSVGEVAAQSRSMHKSQGFGAAPQRGSLTEYFRLLAGEPMQHSLMDGIDLSWDRVQGSEKLKEQLRALRAEFIPEHPERSVDRLFLVQTALKEMPECPFRQRKSVEVQDLLAAVTGLFASATCAQATAIPGSEVKIALTAINRSSVDLTLRAAQISAGVSHETVAIDKALANNHPVTVEHTVRLPATIPFTTPFWLSEPPTRGLFTVSDRASLGLAEEPPAIAVELVFSAGNRLFSLTKPVQYVWTDPVAGERQRPLAVMPKVTLAVQPLPMMFPDGQAKSLSVVLTATDRAQGHLQLKAPEGFDVVPNSAAFSLPVAGASRELVFAIRPLAKLVHESDSVSGQLVMILEEEGDALEPAHTVATIDYPHFPLQTIVSEARLSLVRFNQKRAARSVGYIPGAGDQVAEALRSVGYEVEVLGDAAITKENLRRYEAVVVGVRAFNTNPLMKEHYQPLMDYVSAGGTLVVQYNTQNWISKVAGPIGPWPLTISQDRVTDETAQMTWLDPHHPFSSSPNRLDGNDFTGWVQERGLYFASQWDEHYQPIFSLSDKNESPKKGGLLVGRYGKGTYIYTGLAFFRQLPAGVPGAFRLFANLLAKR
jgi:LmbE family N-acetylglucosaminyl deacetylase